MKKTIRPEIPEDKIFQIKNDTKKIDFSKPYKFLYFDWWFNLLTFPFFILCYIVVFFITFHFGFRVEGKKNKKILRKQGCITISNHCHYFDTVLANYVVYPKRLYTAVVQRNYEVPYIRRILRFLKAFPIPQGALGLKMIIPPVGEALKRGYHVHFLPEGDLVYLSQTIHHFHPGAFFLSYLHQAPLLPMVYILKRRKLFGKELSPFWIKVKLVIGEFMTPPALTKDGKIPREALDDMIEKAASWMERIIAENHGSPHEAE